MFVTDTGKCFPTIAKSPQSKKYVFYFILGFDCVLADGAFNNSTTVEKFKPISPANCKDKCIQYKLDTDASITGIHYRRSYKACFCVKDQSGSIQIANNLHCNIEIKN